MSQLTGIRKAITAALTDFPEVRVAVGPAEYDAVMQPFIVRVLVAGGGLAAEAELDSLLSDEPGSIKATLEADRRLGGAVDDLIVRKHSGHQLFPVPGGQPRLGSQVTVEVLI